MLYSLLNFLYKSSQKSTLFDDLITQSTTAPMNDRPALASDVDLLLEELRMASEIVEQHRLLPRMVCGSNEPYTITVFFCISQSFEGKILDIYIVFIQ